MWTDNWYRGRWSSSCGSAVLTALLLDWLGLVICLDRRGWRRFLQQLRQLGASFLRSKRIVCERFLARTPITLFCQPMPRFSTFETLKKWGSFLLNIQLLIYFIWWCQGSEFLRRFHASEQGGFADAWDEIQQASVPSVPHDLRVGINPQIQPTLDGDFLFSPSLE